ncbi:MAG: hypothetical protein ACLQG5_06980 [Methanobacterium sp.]|jgi:hypothetical protein
MTVPVTEESIDENVSEKIAMTFCIENNFLKKNVDQNVDLYLVHL